MRATLLTVIALVFLLFSGTPAVAVPADVIIDDVRPELSAAPDRKAEFTLTNLTSTALKIDVTPAVQEPNCRLGPPSPGELVPAQPVKVSVTVPPSCTVAGTGLKFTVRVGTTPIDVTAMLPEQAKPKWQVLQIYKWLFLVTFVLALLACLLLLVIRGKWVLSYLDSAWSFKDSWAGNVTVIGGVLTGVFGTSGVVKALLGEDAESAVAPAVVGAAVSAAFVAAGPIVALSIKWDKKFTTFGLFLAAALTMTGALGELWIVTIAALGLDLGGLQERAWTLGVLGTVLLLWYGISTLYRAVVDGTTPPAPAPQTESDAIIAAKLVAAAISAPLTDLQKDEVRLAVEAVEAGYPAYGTSFGDEIESSLRRRSASI